MARGIHPNRFSPFQVWKDTPFNPCKFAYYPAKNPRTQRFYGFIVLRGSALIIKKPQVGRCKCDANRTCSGSFAVLTQTWPKLQIDRLRSCEDATTSKRHWGAVQLLPQLLPWRLGLVQLHQGPEDTWEGPCSNRMLPCKVPFCCSSANLWIFSEGGPSVRCTSLTRRKEQKCPDVPREAHL